MSHCSLNFECLHLGYGFFYNFGAWKMQFGSLKSAWILYFESATNPAISCQRSVDDLGHWASISVYSTMRVRQRVARVHPRQLRYLLTARWAGDCSVSNHTNAVGVLMHTRERQTGQSPCPHTHTDTRLMPSQCAMPPRQTRHNWRNYSTVISQDTIYTAQASGHARNVISECRLIYGRKLR